MCGEKTCIKKIFQKKGSTEKNFRKIFPKKFSEKFFKKKIFQKNHTTTFWLIPLRKGAERVRNIGSLNARIAGDEGAAPFPCVATSSGITIAGNVS